MNEKRVYAGFWIRFGAHVIDFVLVNGVELLIEYGISTPLGLSALNQQIFGVILAIVISYWYYCRFQVSRGTTLGKKWLGIYVIDEKTGASLSHRQAVIRLVGYVCSYLILGCGFLMAAFHPEKKGLHDLMAGTVSLKKKKEAV